jgi:hypothetical protein
MAEKPMPPGRVVPPAEFTKLVEEELAQLLAATSTDVRLLTSDELDKLRTSARKTVERRLRSATVVGTRQRVELSHAIDLWAADDSGAVRAVQAADDRDAELRDVRAEFASARTPIDESSGLLHKKAMLVLAATGKQPTEALYMRALAAVSSDEARRVSEDDVAEHVRTAEALSELAEARLRERGVSASSDGYDDLYVAEIAAVGKQFGVDYYERGAK